MEMLGIGCRESVCRLPQVFLLHEWLWAKAAGVTRRALYSPKLYRMLKVPTMPVCFSLSGLARAEVRGKL